MKIQLHVLLAALVLAWGIPGHADILELKNGSVLTGKYTGGTAGTLRFQTNAGLQVIQTAEIIALTFADAGGQIAPPTAATPPPAAPIPLQPVAAQPVTPPPAGGPRIVTLPGGTTLLVRMMDSVSSRNRPGSTFTTKLEYNLVVGQAVVLKAGTKIYGKIKSATQARRAIGRSTLDIRLTTLIIGGKPVPITTTGFKAAGEASIAKAARGAAAGALIGSIAGDSDGAKKGAAIGATMGALRRGQTITIPPGALLEFNLAQPMKLTVGQ